MSRDPMSPPAQPEHSLTAHGGFVRSLARALLSDAHLAEDVAQEAWLRWHTHGAGAANPRAWLARVVRNLSANATRARGRRAAREEAAARPEPLRAGDEEAAEAEVLRTLVEAVLALEPVLRDTLIGRYFRGLDARTLARESGTPEPTVRDRERRALAELRQRLEGRFGDRRAWGLALARLAGASAVQLPTGSSTAALASALAVAGVGVGLVLQRWRGVEGASELAPGTSLEHHPGAAVTKAEAESEPALDRAPDLRAERRAQASDGGSGSSHVAMSAPQVVVRGRFVTSTGLSLAGVAYALGVGGPIVGTGRPAEPPFPEGIAGLGGSSESDGRFELAFARVETHSLGLSAEFPGFSRVDREVGHWPAGEYELGDVALYRSATWSGRVVDSEGQALTGITWRVSAAAAGDLVQNEAYQGFRSARTDPTTAEFRLEGLLPGLNRVSLRSDTADEQQLEAMLVEGETKRLDLVYAGADPRRRLAVVPSVRPLEMPVERAFLHLVGPDGRRHELAPPAAASKSGATHSGYWFEPLEPGSYTLECDDPRFQFVRLEGLQTGTVARPILEGSSALAITVLDADGASVEADEVQLELCAVNFWPRDFRARRGQQWAAGGLVRCVAGDYFVRVRHGGASGVSRVDGLAPASRSWLPDRRPWATAQRARSVACT